MTYADFDTVFALPAQEQRRLLVEGDAPERLWAAWAVALRIGRDAVPSLTTTGALHAPSGLRRQLVVVVAGLGGRDVLRVIANQDDAPAVRAAACAYFIRTAPRSDDEEVMAFAAEHLRSASNDIREAVLLEHEAGRLRLPEPLLLGALGDPHPDNRALACRCLRAASLSDAGLRAFVEALDHETEPHLRRAMFEALPRSSYRTLFEGLRASSTVRVAEILDLALEGAKTLEWSEVMPLAVRGDAAVVRRLLWLLRGQCSSDAVVWAARVCARWLEGRIAGRARDADEDEAARLARWLVCTNLSREIVDTLDPVTVAALVKVFEEELADLVAHWSEEDPGYDDDGVGAAMVDLHRCISLLRAPHG